MTLLAHRMVGAGAQRAVVLHGVLGRKNNWGGIARAWSKTRPEMEIVLVDLRLHGDSRNFPPPHTIAAAGDDVANLIDTLGECAHLIGHSLGAKVACAAARSLAGHHKLDRMTLIDAGLGPNPHGFEQASGAQVLEALRALPKRFPSRDAFLQAIVSHGLSKRIAAWLAMNLQPHQDNGLQLGLDLAGIEALLRDFFDHDAWSDLDAVPDPRKQLIVGELSDSVPLKERERFASLGSVEVVPGAGHWVHADQQQLTLRLLAQNPQ